jgi:uncharacterized protein (TIGR03067 family)
MLRSSALIFGIVLGYVGDDPADLKSMQGNWTMVSFEVNGEATPDDQVKQGRLSVAKDVYTPTLGGRSMAFTLLLNPEKTPKTFDLTVRDGANKGRTYKGIYKLDGDTLTMCRALTEETERPTEFSTGAESGCSLVVWRRAKP